MKLPIGSLFPKIKIKTKNKNKNNNNNKNNTRSFSSASSFLTLSLFDRDSKITNQELQSLLRCMGPTANALTDGDLAAMVKELDRDGDGCISLQELAGAVNGGEELRDAFEMYDVDGDGKISAEELRGMMAVLGEGEEECGIEECRRMIRGVDSDGDGFVCFQDFVRMMVVVNL